MVLKTKVYENLNKRNLFAFLLIACFILIIPGCDVIFGPDGNKDTMLVNSGGYFYLVDKATNTLIMFDVKLNILKKWNLNPVAMDTSIQGITFDGKNLWVSASGSTDMITQIDISGDTVTALKSFPAPPSKRGTIRDITFDGVNLWAVNSGSTTYSIPATLYKLDAQSGTILAEYVLPTADPYGLTYVVPGLDVFGRGPDKGIYYTDTQKDKVYKFIPEKVYFDTVFSTPVPPRGRSYIFPSGLTYDGRDFWLINSSDVADHLYKLNYTGLEMGRFDMPFTMPGPIVYANYDARIGSPPVLISIAPNTGLVGTTINVDIYGANFKKGTGLKADFGEGITVNSVNYIYPTQLKANLTISPTASLGKRKVIVTNPDGLASKGDSLFEVKQVITTPFLWLAEQDTAYLFKIRLTDTTIVKQWDTRSVVSSPPQGVAYDGINIWMCVSGTDRRIFRLNTSGATLSSDYSFAVPTSSGTARGIVFHEGNLWLAISNPSKIYKLNPSTGAVLDSLSAPGTEPRGITFANGQLYCNDITIDSVFTYNFSTGKWTSVFATPTPAGGTTSNRFATGMTFDGSHFWLANSTNNFDHVYKVTMAGEVVFTFQAPRIGTAQVTGIVYTEEQ